eukprot:g35473.t1
MSPLRNVISGTEVSILWCHLASTNALATESLLDLANADTTNATGYHTSPNMNLLPPSMLLDLLESALGPLANAVDVTELFTE